MVRSSIWSAAVAASRCSTVCTTVSPWPSTVRRSVDCTSLKRAGITGTPGRSVRRNTIPCPDGAPRQTADTEEPVCRPTPLTRASCASVRLGTREPLRNQPLELIYDWSQPIHGRLRPQKLPVRTGWMTAEGSARGDIAEDGALRSNSSPVSDDQMIGNADVAGEDDVVSDPGAAGDPDACHDQAALPNPHVVS